MLSNETVWIVNILMYPITYDPNPLASAGHALDLLREQNPQISAEQISLALHQALTLSGWSNEIAAIGDHTEEGAKTYLRSIKSLLDHGC